MQLPKESGKMTPRRRFNLSRNANRVARRFRAQKTILLVLSIRAALRLLASFSAKRGKRKMPGRTIRG